MQLPDKIVDLTQLFYKDETNSILTVFWNSLYIAFFLLPLGINLSTPFFIIAIVVGLIHTFKTKNNFVLRNKVLLLFPLYFLLMVISLLYTENIQDGLQLIQRSLTLLLFPIIFLFVKEDASTVKRLFNFLLYGLILSFFINFGLTVYDIFNSKFKPLNKAGIFDTIFSTLDFVIKDWSQFTGNNFSRLINPNYTSLYIVLVLSYFLKKTLSSTSRTGINILLFLYLFLLSSKVAYAMLFIISILFILSITDKIKKNMAIIILLLGSIIFLNNPRIFEFYSRVKNFENQEDISAVNTEKSRVLSWDTSLRLIKEAPLLGYGVGDANDVLIHKYKELGYSENYQNRYNAHNQFLQTLLQTGLLGFSILAAIFIILGSRMNRSRNEFAVFLILLIAISFESMLVRFNGIVFFSVITPLLLKKRSILSSRIIRNTKTA